MESRFALAQSVAREAGVLVRSLLGTDIEVRSKDVRSNLVTEADTRAEALIRATIATSFPADAVLAEEGGASGDPRSGRWIIDPLDGTTNYAHGYRCFCVSIAYEHEDAVRFGCVYDPMADEMYTAQQGEGARCNGAPIHVSSCEELQAALLVTGFPAHRVADPRANLAPLADFMTITRAIRRDGSAALDLCYVACGRFDGFWESGLHAWDVAAGSLIVEEAGGTVSDYRGRAMPLDADQLLASNGRLHRPMLDVLAPYA
ncbi:MAG TPA: inositol monophosphatase family protein [Candidatus Eremiobacteraceae bacterium]|nr:inositol monophosphatase family protein [Candidatus Eremiobacteraceae bacterium]